MGGCCGYRSMLLTAPGATSSGVPGAGPKRRSTPRRLGRSSRTRSRGAHMLSRRVRSLVAGSGGRVGEARAWWPRRICGSAARYDDVNKLRIRWAIGHVGARKRRPRRGRARARGVAGGARRRSASAEPGWQPMLPDVVEALMPVGRLDEAEAVLRQLEHQAAALRHRWATPAALRCRAELLLAREPTAAAAAAAEQAGRCLRRDRLPARPRPSAARRRSRATTRRAADASSRHTATGDRDSRRARRHRAGWNGRRTSFGAQARARATTGS